MRTCSRAPLLGCCVRSSAAIASLPRGCSEGWRPEARLVNRRRRLSARPCARRHHRRLCRGQSRRRGAYRPAIGSVEVCTPRAPHDAARQHLEGPYVGQRDTPISVFLLAACLIGVVQCGSMDGAWRGKQRGARVRCAPSATHDAIDSRHPRFQGFMHPVCRDH